jgi:hypothetical protein
MEEKREQGGHEPTDATEVPPDTSEHPSHQEEIGGQGAEDPAEMADEDRYRKGPGW